MPPITLPPDINVTVTSPAPQPVATTPVYEVTYWLEGTGIWHTLSLREARMCVATRHKLLDLAAVTENMRVSQCLPANITE